MKNLSPQLAVNASPKLLDQARGILRARHYSYKTEQSYLNWMKRYILFHNKRHPKDMGEKEISRFLTHLAVYQHSAASTQNQALCAIIFLYKHVLKKDVGDLECAWAKKPKRLPTVFTRKEVKSVPEQLSGDKWIMANLLYGAGLRLMECLRCECRTLILKTIKSLSKRWEALQTKGRRFNYGEIHLGKIVRTAGG